VIEDVLTNHVARRSRDGKDFNKQKGGKEVNTSHDVPELH
jgi:hypothetical protein